MTSNPPTVPTLDFPAAHSMDTDWFAVDRDGHVAVCFSGEAGAVPEKATNDLIFGLLLDVVFEKGGELPLDASMQKASGEIRMGPLWRDQFPPAAFGFFQYNHSEFDNWISGPYEREVIPSQPIRFDQLPEKLRKLAQFVQFDKLSFAETPWLQPIEHTNCTSWESAWLASDKKTIRPIPGMEEEYEAAYEDIRDLAHDGKYTIEPPRE